MLPALIEAASLPATTVNWCGEETVSIPERARTSACSPVGEIRLRGDGERCSGRTPNSTCPDGALKLIGETTLTGVMDAGDGRRVYLELVEAACWRSASGSLHDRGRVWWVWSICPKEKVRGWCSPPTASCSRAAWPPSRTWKAVAGEGTGMLCSTPGPRELEGDRDKNALQTRRYGAARGVHERVGRHVRLSRIVRRANDRRTHAPSDSSRRRPSIGAL